MCSHAWWQNRERLQELREGWSLADMPEARQTDIKENVEKGLEPGSFKPKIKGAVTVFIGNIPFTYEEKDVGEIFTPYGEVASIVLVREPDGRSRGYAFVDMVEKAAGAKAIESLNGSELDGRNLNVALGGSKG